MKAAAAALAALFAVLLPPVSSQAADLVLMVIDNNSYLANRAAAGLDTAADVEVVAAGELAGGGERLRRSIDEAKVLVVDVMGRELTDYLDGHIGLAGKTVYALRSSVDDEGLRRRGYIFDEEVSAYYDNMSVGNVRNMLRLVISRHLDEGLSYGEAEPVTRLGIYHPDADGLFTDAGAYERWLRGRPGHDPRSPRIGLLFFASFLTEGQREPVDYIIRRLEEAGFSVTACFGRDEEAVRKFLLDEDGVGRVDLVLAFSLKFYSALTEGLARALRNLDVPILSAVNLYGDTIEKWRESPVGIGSTEAAWTMAAPEISGLVEPTVLSAKEEVADPETSKRYYLSRPVAENVERLIPRLRAWAELRRKPNAEKKVAVIFYNHSRGKHNIGASYLNVFASLREIAAALAARGYRTGGVPGERELRETIVAGARNIGSWAPGELDGLVAAGRAVLLDMETYREWFSRLPADFREAVIAQWGEPEDSGLMVHGAKIVIPMVRSENLVMMPEPARAWSDNPAGLAHDTTLYPHHQYIAAYLWLKEVFGADAVIHLGTHATYEWTPGKQAGLSPSCSPEVLTTDIPNFYPYIVDDVGEALQAKRRGRGVMLSHMTPLLRPSGLYAEYARMAELADEYERARSVGSVTADEKFSELVRLAQATGLAAETAGRGEDRLHGGADGRSRFVHELTHYLEEMREEMIPYGMHTYGRAMDADEARAMAGAVAGRNPDADEAEVARLVEASAQREMENLLRGLEGRYVEPGEGNDPLRNPQALPTGRNLYGFNPARLPSREAWRLGKEAADEIIRTHLEEHGRYPRKVAVVLWAVELLRNEGVNESTILWLLGVRPRWLPSGRVAGLEVVPGRELGRPRIDVLVSASGLYRDLFPHMIEWLDEAVGLALRQTDVENLVAAAARRAKARLIEMGLDEEEARELSRLRVFSEEPGSYGNGVAEAAASPRWRDESEIADIYERRMGFVFGGGRWGGKAGRLLAAQLADVDVAVHSRSSSLYGLLDNDDMFQYLGGLAAAVRRRAGRAPETLVTSQLRPGAVEVEELSRVMGRELRSRNLNPRWIEGMKGEDYAGAGAMADFVENLWGWQVTTPEEVDASLWRQVFEVYVRDSRGLDIEGFTAGANPWARQAMTARMLEAVRRGYWSPSDEVKAELASEYVESVAAAGPACSELVCANPRLARLAADLAARAGVASETVETFVSLLERAAGRQSRPRDEELEEIGVGPARGRPLEAGEGSAPGGDGTVEVEGFAMEEVGAGTAGKGEGPPRSAAAATAALAAAVAALLFYGARRARRR
ncbi:MAG TPA: cobaltochelatase subunit CobN [Deltaproteobacteria bacterium]|nr:cobaltochelatase subunit CobN [Deltaproteobacteria bacterium]